MAEHSQHSPFPPDMWVFPDKPGISADVEEKRRTLPSLYRTALIVTGVLCHPRRGRFHLPGCPPTGFSQHGPWGYYAAMFSFVFLVTGLGPPLRHRLPHHQEPLAQAHLPDSRASSPSSASSTSSSTSPSSTPCRPSTNNPNFGPGVHGELAIRRTLWMEVPIGAPHWWNLLGIIALALCSLAILWLSAVPDMAESRQTATGFRGALYRMLSGHWFGTKRQWFYQKASLAILGALYFMMLIFVQFLIVSDFAMSLIPGWKDSILPPLYTITGFQSALSLTLIIAFIMRRKGGYGAAEPTSENPPSAEEAGAATLTRGYIGISPFWSASKVQLGLTLLWTYHLFAFFITMWYGRLEVEQNLIKYLIFESYTGIFWANVILIFFIPFFMPSSGTPSAKATGDPPSPASPSSAATSSSSSACSSPPSTPATSTTSASAGSRPPSSPTPGTYSSSSEASPWPPSSTSSPPASSPSSPSGRSRRAPSTSPRTASSAASTWSSPNPSKPAARPTIAPK